MLTFWCYHLLIALPRPNLVENRKGTDLESSKEQTIVLMVDPEDEDSMDDEADEGNGSNRGVRYNLFGSRIILEYFEKNIPAGVVIPRELQWPYNRPVWLCRLISRFNEASTLSSGD